MNQESKERLAHAYARLGDWCATWGIFALARSMDIRFSDRIGSALGRCELHRGRVTLNALLLHPSNESLLLETLCHEAAHLAVHLRYGPAVEEHGPEWEDFMQRAGFKPRAVIDWREVPDVRGVKTPPSEQSTRKKI